MRTGAVFGAAFAAVLAAIPGRARAQASHVALSRGLSALGAPLVLPALSPLAAGSLSVGTLSPASLSPVAFGQLPASPVVAPAPAVAAMPAVQGRRDGLLSSEHAPVLFAALPEMSRLSNATAKETAETDFMRRLGTALAEPAEATAPSVESQLQKAEVLSLRTTQMAAGMKEVEHKIEKLKSLEKEPHELKLFLKANPVPVVLGPGGRMYIIDHHHLVRAAWEANIPEVYIEVKADLSGLAEPAFWKKMKDEAWVYPYDEAGKPRDVAELPKDVRGLVDDPYRSVAWAVRERGGFTKTGKPFAEFKWADFFRERVKIHPKHHGFEEAVDEAMELAKSPEASQLPGYVGSK